MKKFIQKISNSVLLALIIFLYNCGPAESPDPQNDAPIVSDQSFSVDENSPVGMVVGAIVASDPNRDVLSYTITGGNTDNAFDLNSTTGEITVSTSSALDFETTPTFQLKIEVADEKDSNEALITINLNDINEDSNTSTNFTFGSDVYELNAGTIEKYGISNPTSSGSATHYNSDFIIIDGNISSVTEGGDIVPAYSNLSFAIYVALYAKGTTGIEVGTYSFQNASTGDFSNDFFSDLQVWRDNNGNKTIDEGDFFYDAIAGQVTVTEESDSYILNFSITVVNEDNASDQKTLTGEYAGTYKTYDYTN